MIAPPKMNSFLMADPQISPKAIRQSPLTIMAIGIPRFLRGIGSVPPRRRGEEMPRRQSASPMRGLARINPSYCCTDFGWSLFGVVENTAMQPAAFAVADV